MEKISNLFGIAAMSFILEIICLDSLDGTVKYAAAIALAVSFAFFVWKGVSAFEEGKVRTDDKAEEALKLQSDTLVAAINKLCNQQHENNQSMLASMQSLSEVRVSELKKMFLDIQKVIEACSQKNVAELSGFIADYQIAREQKSLELFSKFEASNKALLSGTLTKIGLLCDSLVEKNQEIAVDIVQKLTALEKQSIDANASKIEGCVQNVSNKIETFSQNISANNDKLISELDESVVSAVNRTVEINERMIASVNEIHNSLVSNSEELTKQLHNNNASVLSSMQSLSEERLDELRKLFSDMHDAIEAGSQKNVAELSGVIADYRVVREKMSLEMFNKFEDSNKKLLSGTVTKIELLCDDLVEKNQELTADIMQNLANLEQQSLKNSSTRIESFVQDVSGKLDGFVHDILLHNGKIIAEMDSNIVASVKRIAEINERTAAGVKDMHNSLVNNNNALTDQLHSTYEEISEFVADVIEERSKNIDDLLKALKDNNDNFKDDMATLSKNLKRKIDELPNMLKDSSDDILEKFDEGIKKLCANQRDFVLEIKQYNDEMKKMSEDDLEILRELLCDGK